MKKIIITFILSLASLQAYGMDVGSSLSSSSHPTNKHLSLILKGKDGLNAGVVFTDQLAKIWGGQALKRGKESETGVITFPEFDSETVALLPDVMTIMRAAQLLSKNELATERLLKEFFTMRFTQQDIETINNALAAKHFFKFIGLNSVAQTIQSLLAAKVHDLRTQGQEIEIMDLDFFPTLGHVGLPGDPKTVLFNKQSLADRHLLNAVIEENLDKVNYLLEQEHANPNAFDLEGKSVLKYAIENGKAKVANALRAAGVKE